MNRRVHYTTPSSVKCAPFLCLAILASRCCILATAQQVIQVTSAQQLVDATSQWSITGGDVQLTLAADISLADVNFTTPNSTSVGRLVLGGSPRGKTLDCAMKSVLLQPFNSLTTTMVIQDLVFTDLCSSLIVWNKDINLYVNTATQLTPFPRSRTAGTITRRNMSLYIPYGELKGRLFWAMYERLPFVSVKNFIGGTVYKYIAASNAVPLSVTMYSLRLAYMQLSGGNDYNVTYKATNDPTDPHRLQSLGGTSMPHRFCDGPLGNGTLLTDKEINVSYNATLDPLLLANDDATLQSAIQEISQYTFAKSSLDPTAVIMQIGNASLAAVQNDVTSFIYGDLILHGQMGSEEPRVFLSLGNQSGLITLVTNATLYIHLITLTDLDTDTIPGAPGLTSALPLWGFTRTSFSDSRLVVMDNVTLVLQPNEYCQLLSAALRGTAWLSAANVTRPLLQGISTFVVAGNVQPSTSSILLSQYVGWGVTATNLYLTPSVPLPSNITLPDYPTGISSDSTTDNTSTQKLPVGAIVGIVLGGIAVFCILSISACCYCQRQRLRQQASFSTDLSAVEVHILEKHQLSIDIHKEHVASSADFFADMPGIIKGEPFTRATAMDYNWALPDPKTVYNPVVGGNSDGHLDNMGSDGQAGPAIQLTSQQVKDQIILLKEAIFGRGATALVFRCLWPRRFGSNSVLAAKVLKDGYEFDQYKLQSFQYEAAVLSSLNPPHPNVIRLYGYCLEPPTVCLILEVLSTSLDAVLYKQPRSGSSFKIPSFDRLSMQQVLQISTDIAAGLKYLHDMPFNEEAALEETASEQPGGLISVLSERRWPDGQRRKTQKIVHRDLKPANILLDECGRAKISDFGLARKQATTTISTENLAAGTLPYMAPELLVSKHIGLAPFPATKRIDIYSMGMIMWEMLAGQVPWSQMNEPGMLAAVLSGRRPDLVLEPPYNAVENSNGCRPLNEIQASIHALPEFNAIINECWQQREHRRPSAETVYERLMALLDQHGCSLQPLEMGNSIKTATFSTEGSKDS